MIRVGVDTGGTFTDCMLINDEDGSIALSKVPSTPQDLSDGIFVAVERAASQLNLPLRDIRFLAHGTTAATNAVLEGKTAKVGLLTTRGFRDCLEIGTQMRPELYNLFQQKPAPLVPRRLRRDISERIDPAGQEVEALDRTASQEIIADLLAEDIEAIAICLLFSYANGANERALKSIVESLDPDVYTVQSSEICPKFREYPRMSTTALNASVAPVVAGYLSRLSRGLQERDIDIDPFIMQSNGGIMSAGEAGTTGAHHLFLSGPAAGLAGAAFVATAAGFPDVVTLDMGGTSCDVGVILGGMPREVSALTIQKHYPLEVTALDLHTIGAGGGSIGWIDTGGDLRVGPQSAGADPGPACYGQGGTEPTITDANLVLGRLSPGSPLAGSLQLDADAAERALIALGAALGMNAVDTALGMLTIANASMVGALQVVLTRRGHDPRDFTLLPFGGAGPLHAVELAREMGIRRILVLHNPGLLSALGLLATDLKHDYVQTLIGRIGTISSSEILAGFAQLHEKGAAQLSRDGVASSDQRFLYTMDVRYLGQEYTLPVAVDPDDADLQRTVALRFHQQHEERYGHAAPDEPLEVVNLRVTALGTMVPLPAAYWIPDAPGGASPQPYMERPVYFREAGGFIPTPIFRRADLPLGSRFSGPAVVEQTDSTILIHPGNIARVDQMANIVIDQPEVEA